MDIALLAVALGCGGGDDRGGAGDAGRIDAGRIDGGDLPGGPDGGASCAGAPEPVRHLVTAELERPVYLTSPPGDQRLFVLEQWAGLVRIIDGDQLLAAPFLDLSVEVDTPSGERGLLGLAFHPDYAQNGRFFVTFTANRDTDPIKDLVLAELAVSQDDPNRADPGMMREILFVPANERGHYGAQIAFGADGMLYLAVGDVDQPLNPTGSAQSLDSLAGKMLRIDVGDAPGDYSAPPDNPFIGQGREEIWAYGLRQPWRWAFDGDNLFIADVGHLQIEEVDALPVSQAAGANFGWAVMEGTICSGVSCDVDAVLPVHEYEHAGPSAIIGGYVYRGAALPCLRGRYFYSDHKLGDVRSFVLEGDQAVDHMEHPSLKSSLITSFGQDAAGELYILELEGSVYRIAPE